MIPVVLAIALVFAAQAEQPGRTALEAFAHSLAAHDGLPRSERVLRRICERHLVPAFRPVANGGARRWQSLDGQCLVDITPSDRPDRAAAQIRFSCHFVSALNAEQFLRDVAIRPMHPPLPDHFPAELHHRGSISSDERMVGAEYDLFPAGDGYDASAAFTDGWRVVLPDRGETSQR